MRSAPTCQEWVDKGDGLTRPCPNEPLPGTRLCATHTPDAAKLRELAEAAEAVLVSQRPIRVGADRRFNNPWYGPQIERLDKLVKEVLGDVKP